LAESIETVEKLEGELEKERKQIADDLMQTEDHVCQILYKSKRIEE
jgi:hypothetical protein